MIGLGRARGTERSWRDLPVWIRVLLLAALILQPLSLQQQKRSAKAPWRPLPEPLDVEVYRALAPGSSRLLAALLLLRLQLHDDQKGRQYSYRHLDYDRLARWLLTLYRLNPDSDYPGFLASRVYGQVKDPQRVRRMIEVIEELLRRDPQRHWRRMTEAVLLAKHQLGDLDLALSLAAQVAELPHTVDMPRWARDMKLIALDDLGRDQDALRLIASELTSAKNLDADERRFLQSRLLKLQQELSESGQLPAPLPEKTPGKR
jgi:hypothetical protein